MLDWIGELLIVLLEALVPEPIAHRLGRLVFYAAAIASFAAGAWVLYRAINDPSQQWELYLTFIAWLSAAFFWYIARKF